MTVTVDHRLMQLLVCPVCKGPLRARSPDAGSVQGLECPADRLLFPVRDGIALMLESEARSLDEGEAAGASSTLPPSPPSSPPAA